MTRIRPKVRLLVYVVLVLIAMASTAGMLFVRLNTRGVVSGTNYNKIQIGMTQSEVEDMLGKPDEALPPLTYKDLHADEDALRIGKSPYPHKMLWWRANDHMITVHVDANGRVTGKSYARDPQIGLFHRMIDSLGL